MSTLCREDFDNRSISGQSCLDEEITLAIMTGRGKLLIIKNLNKYEKMRYSEIKVLFHEMSNRVLTKQLRELEQDNIITRIVYPEIPPRVEYSLTDHGKTLLPVIQMLRLWGNENKNQYFGD